MHRRTSRRNGCCPNKRSFHQLRNVVVENGLEWRAIVKKRTLWWNNRLKKAFEWRKMRSRPRYRTDRHLICNNGARKVATLAVKKSKEKSWEEFGCPSDSKYFPASKVFWRTIRRLRGKRLDVTYSIKDLAGNNLTDEIEILSPWREYFEDPKESNRPCATGLHFRVCVPQKYYLCPPSVSKVSFQDE